MPSLKPVMAVAGLYTSRHTRLQDPFVWFHGRLVPASRAPWIRSIGDDFVYSDMELPTFRALDLWLDKNWHFAAHLIKLGPKVGSAFGEVRDFIQGDGPQTDAEATELLGAFLEELGLMHQAARNHNIPLVVLLINDQKANGVFRSRERHYNNAVSAFCDRLGIPVVDPLPVFQLRADKGKALFRLEGDHHWSAEAHRVAAQQIRKVVEQTELLAY